MPGEGRLYPRISPAQANTLRTLRDARPIDNVPVYLTAIGEPARVAHILWHDGRPRMHPVSIATFRALLSRDLLAEVQRHDDHVFYCMSFIGSRTLVWHERDGSRE